MRKSRGPAILLLSALLAGCGGDDDDDQPGGPDAAAGIDAAALPDGTVDATPDAVPPDAAPPPCVELDDPAATLDSYPAIFAGNTDNTNDNMHVQDRVCTVAPAELLDMPGEDQVVELVNLTPGATYVIKVQAVGNGPYFYVITDCDEEVRGPGEGDCLLFERVNQADTTIDRIVAPPDGHAYVVVDQLFPPPEAGFPYVLQVYEPECDELGDCPEGALACADSRCHECVDDFDCTDPATPICDFDDAVDCVASTAACDGDDAAEDADDGPAGATALTPPPAPGSPQAYEGSVCTDGSSAPDVEQDYFTLTVTSGAPRGVALSWDDTSAFLTATVVDADGASLRSSGGSNPGFVDVTDLPSGTYYLVVNGLTSATVSYRLTDVVPECATSFDCTEASAPQCDGRHLCVGGPSACVDDDAGEDGDDGPIAATVLTPAAAAPAEATGAICATTGERDFYRVVVPTERRIAVELDWPDDTAALQMGVYDQFGATAGFPFGKPARLVLNDVPAIDYYVEVQRFGGDDATASAAYTVTVSVPACGDSFDCDGNLAPVCAAESCVVGTDDCTGEVDDAGDGPAAAVVLAPAVAGSASHEASICDVTPGEVDYYAVTVADGDGLTATLSSGAVAAGRRLELAVYAAGGAMVGWARWTDPEVVVLSNLAAGTYYLGVTEASGLFSADPLSYTIEVSRAAGGCDTDADCASEHATQLYRATCLPSGACASVDGNRAVATGERCDSDDDCTAGACSYSLFQAGADDSACTVGCTSTEACAAELGAGYHCSFSTQSICRPNCAADVDCGINRFGSVPDPDQPWDYQTCDVASGACGF